MGLKKTDWHERYLAQVRNLFGPGVQVIQVRLINRIVNRLVLENS